MHWLFWIGVVLAVDAFIGLAGLKRFQTLAPRVPIYRVAVIEAVLAVALLMTHYLLTR